MKIKENELCRCPWVDLSKEDYVKYHDEEWGVPVHDDRKIFEFLTLESAQAGLSWYTVLKKRQAYRKAFDNFEPEVVARYDSEKIESLMLDAGIIRNRMKITASVNNAQIFLKIKEEFGSFAKYIWRFVEGKPIINYPKTIKDYPAVSKESDALSRDLKQRGFKFMGSTVCYAHMQATGMVNDHGIDCYRKTQIIDSHK
ncbi:MAG TPA: DNA-3-methyladenine glycosylase I [Lentisphaeria bacterium]|nr:MAG: DNA-3-methyladenine glycosylase [Lentisphaerae bacterium GWF2_38_69]HBM14910.1 DNA-3-methyladenine glycosylase I [Lentisphaeria bacterium]